MNSLSEAKVILPQAPDEIIGSLLDIKGIEIFPLSVGDVREGQKAGDEYMIIAPAGIGGSVLRQGGLTVTYADEYSLLSPGQAAVLYRNPRQEYILQAVSDCLCEVIHLKGLAAEQLLDTLIRPDSVYAEYANSQNRHSARTVLDFSVPRDFRDTHDIPDTPPDRASFFHMPYTCYSGSPDILSADSHTQSLLLCSHGAVAVQEAVGAFRMLEEKRESIPGDLASACGYRLLTRLRTDHLRRYGQNSGENTGKNTPVVEAAIGIIQEEFPYLSGVEELAERLEVSQGYLSRVFHAAVGMTLTHYITRVRIEYAKIILRDPEASVNYAAEASGFANGNYFAKVFRRETGMSPRDYREVFSDSPISPEQKTRLPW